MHTRGKGRNLLERQRIPLGAAKYVFPEWDERRESVWNTHFVLYTNNELKSCLHHLRDCRDNERNSQSVFLLVV